MDTKTPSVRPVRVAVTSVALFIMLLPAIVRVGQSDVLTGRLRGNETSVTGQRARALKHRGIARQYREQVETAAYAEQEHNAAAGESTGPAILADEDSRFLRDFVRDPNITSVERDDLQTLCEKYAK